MNGLLFITHRTDKYSYLDSVNIALEGGCRHIQLRMKDISPRETEQAAMQAKHQCLAYGAELYIDDHVEICRNIGAAGVHLGKHDMPPREAREILGPGFIIGSTANTFDDIYRLSREGSDYIGLGPFRFTTTKKNLAPVLGLTGYRDIIWNCRSNGINIPIVAIGGITVDDIPHILDAGANGIALAGTILNAGNPVAETGRVVKTIMNYL